MEVEMRPRKYIVLQVKCPSFLTTYNQNFIICRSCAEIGRNGFSGNSLELNAR
jgi:hypothetical protein